MPFSLLAIKKLFNGIEIYYLMYWLVINCNAECYQIEQSKLRKIVIIFVDEVKLIG